MPRIPGNAPQSAGHCPIIRFVDGRMYFDAEGLLKYAQDHRQAYRSAAPFPHIVIDNFFPAPVLNQVLEGFPTESDMAWRRFRDQRHTKLLSKGDVRLSPSIRHVLAQLRSSEFISFLEELSGVTGLVADPHNGGCHQTDPGGFLEVHVDASWNDRLALYTGINLFVYLNQSWEESYGGHLELWDADAQKCVTRILPAFNRMVIFSSGERTYHGHPTPLACPSGASRKSLAANFCLSRRPPSQSVFRRSAVYRANLDTRRLSARLLTSMLMPPLLAEGLRRARARAAGKKPPQAC